MAATTKLDLIVLNPPGARLLLTNESGVASYHRVMLDVGDPALIFAANNAHLELMGFPPISDEDMAKIRAACGV